MTQHLCSIVAIPAGHSGPGSLGGFEVTCSCGFVFTTAFESTARLDAAEHVAWMTRSPRRRTRRPRAVSTR